MSTPKKTPPRRQSFRVISQDRFEISPRLEAMLEESMQSEGGESQTPRQVLRQPTPGSRKPH